MSTARAASTTQSLPAYARTAGRAVHVKINPRPRSISDSREVLRVLQQYGEVIMYRHLKHEPLLHAENTALAIYKSYHSAEDAINASPIWFELGRGGFSMLRSGGMSHQDKVSSREQEDNDEIEAIEGQTQGMEIDDAHGEVDESQQSQQYDSEPEEAHTAFVGLNGSKWPVTRSALAAQNTSKSTKTQSPKTFTPNPLPSIASSTEIPIPPPTPPETYSPSQPPIEFELTVSRSSLNHQKYIERQHYYGGFRLNLRSMMADDLDGRVPSQGMADCHINREEKQLRLRLDKGEERKVTSLGEMWREGRTERGKT